ncbi:ABC transporter ATP-binding protein [Paenibacillus albidus]|uniref:ABC transporter ATP-binding protein n=1 Tax=Paenibacillus albidus TaxID=2041023 RepID=A0A917BX24_9BACL|nr:AAA family ATPase [Paenibacillus albidus]GGF59894.1 ABC transporter ATP-binding protein [Paenibacillus albidus]
MNNPMLYMRHVELLRDQVPSFEAYPFVLPAVRNLERLVFTKPVTFLVGENGTGKSTLLEGIAAAWGFNPEGGTLNFSFNTRSSHSSLYEFLRIARGVKRPKDGFFLRAESYYNVASYIDELDNDEDPGECAQPPIKDSYGGKSLHEQSHGESFFAAFVHRFGGRGLYILDEPEAALSPVRQMSLLVRMHELVLQHSQFIIATHSPILMSYPGAEIFLLEGEAMRPVDLEETEHFSVTKAFMNDRKGMLHELLGDT